MYVVTVLFQIKQDALEAFMALIDENASTSLDQESGLKQFDVLTDPDRVAEVFLYEVYVDRAAFDAHLASPHFMAFDAAVVNMVETKVVKTFAGAA